MTTWFTSDLHHKHKNIVKFTDRGVSTSTEQHEEWLEFVWNSTVERGDIVYHLGDFSFAKKYEDIAKFVSKLKGQKIFLKGNHDDRKVLSQLVEDKLINMWYDYKEIKVGETSVFLFHIPDGAWHKQGYGSWHLHGHSHGNYSETKGKMLDVGIDSAYNLTGTHKFFSAEDIAAIMQKKQTVITDHHKEH